jgi:hypothetical protein
MSGSSNGGGIPTINRPGGEESCENLVITTNLASPQANVINGLTVGDILTIQAASASGPIQALNSNNQIAGSIVSREQIRLLNCINGGTQYEAEVLALNTGQCTVQISAI